MAEPTFDSDKDKWDLEIFNITHLIANYFNSQSNFYLLRRYA